jgi:hypothetical protein
VSHRNYFAWPWCLQHACLSTPKNRLEQIDLRVW